MTEQTRTFCRNAGNFKTYEIEDQRKTDRRTTLRPSAPGEWMKEAAEAIVRLYVDQKTGDVPHYVEHIATLIAAKAPGLSLTEEERATVETARAFLNAHPFPFSDERALHDCIAIIDRLSPRGGGANG